ncbi:hypothetical protein LFL96_36415 (plasmid) [Paraburkholderia sp. D15]|uniref:hypothetical protein n=1 Tax=Paraburkholderia sp. D15 TaxID=2880218 RepID=UPI0024795A14|nr:hypothetical protein [Paraburkholderia sp. D15]WGS54971.1 hypothetical protein LFL96_36415 [Paraburkholderia sp. D15]
MIHIKDPAGYPMQTDDPTLFAHQHDGVVSWGAVFAGGVGAAAFALILLTLGTGLGLTALSPWSSGASNAKAFGFSAVVWVCVTAILASGLGGYLAGRLRRRWLTITADELHFRDTAHGFLSWAVATLLTAVILTSAASGAIHAGTQAAATTAGERGFSTMRGDADAALNTWPLGYLVDSLFRRPPSSQPAPAATNESPRREATRIFLNSAATGAQLSPDDASYLGQLVAQRTGLPPAAAQARVTTTYTNFVQKLAALDDAAKAAADRARKITIGASLWLFVSLLMGAFSASLLAIYGGRVRQL